MTPAELDRLWVESMYEVGMGKMIHHVFARKLKALYHSEIVEEWNERVSVDTSAFSDIQEELNRATLERNFPSVASFGEWLTGESTY